jgi:16S rRNA (cytidine1402-2'-O)-methyltransferase
MTRRLLQRNRQDRFGTPRRLTQAPGKTDPDGSPGTLFVVATPIGNLEDITMRAIRILKEVQLVAAEDTRRTRILLNAYQIETPLTSLYEQNEARKSGQIIGRLLRGERVAYVSDAGTPGISDPGYLLVREAIARGIPVTPVPGPSAAIAALSVSGLPMDSFIFLGFLPTKSVRRRQLLLSLETERRTLVFYESPHRLLASLHDMEDLLGSRQIVVSREMTKFHETWLRGPIGRVIASLDETQVRGEVTLIVAGRSPDMPVWTDAELLARCERLRQEEGDGLSRRDMADRVSREAGVPKKRVYGLLLFS